MTVETAAKLLDEAQRLREFATGLRKGLIQDGWSEDGAEEFVIAAAERGI